MSNRFFVQPTFAIADEGAGGEEGSEEETALVIEEAPAEEKPAAPTKEAASEKEENASEEAKDEDDADEDAAEPLTLEALDIPEGLEVDETLSGKFLEVLNDNKLTPAERGNALLGLQKEALGSAAEQLSGAWADTQKEWKSAVETDDDIGGDKLETTMAGINQLVDKYGEGIEDFRQMLDMTGAGNHPAMVKFLNNVAADVLEGGPVLGSPTGGASKSQAEKMFPDQPA